MLYIIIIHSYISRVDLLRLLVSSQVSDIPAIQELTRPELARYIIRLHYSSLSLSLFSITLFLSLPLFSSSLFFPLPSLHYCSFCLSSFTHPLSLPSLHYSSLSPCLSLPPSITPLCLRRVRDKLIGDDRFKLAMEVSTKCQLDATAVWSAWGMACIRVGEFTKARNLLKHCFQVTEYYEYM